MRRVIALLLPLVLVSAAGLAAQARSRPLPRWAPAAGPSEGSTPRAPARERGAPVVGLVVGGLLGGAAGFGAGALVGYALGGGDLLCGDDPCGLEEAAYGAIVGQSVALPLGVHVANGGRGNYGLSLLASAAIGAAGVLVINATNDGTPFLVVPVAQLVSSILIERATGH